MQKHFLTITTIAALFSVKSDYLFAQCPNPLIAPGIICCEQLVCAGEPFAAFEEVTAPEPATPANQLQYQWYGLVNDTNFGSILWRPIAGATQKNFTPVALPSPEPAPNVGYFMREVRKTGCPEWLVSNLVRITIRQPEDCTSSTDEQSTVAAGLSVFPNPASDQLTIFNHEEQDVQVQISTFAGQRIEHLNIGAQSASIVAVSHLQSGIYLMTVTYSDGHTGWQRWVKN